MRVAVCDDDALVGKQIRDMVHQMASIESCIYYADGEKLLNDIADGEEYDAVLMDIQWDGKERGIGWSSQLQDVLPGAKIIYLTGYVKEYVQQIFLSPSNLRGFLIKPIEQNLLQENLQKVMEERKKQNDQKFTFRQGRGWKSLFFCEIDYLESVAHKVQIHARSGEVFECYGRLEQIALAFPAPFLRCHKSYLVNIRSVRQFGVQRQLIMDDGKIIPISKNRYGAIKEQYIAYIKEQHAREKK